MMENNEKLATVETKERRLMLHYWYIDEVKDKEETWLCGNGIVTGHEKLRDSLLIHTPKITKMVMDYEAEELILHTGNGVYHCPFIFCDFDEQEKAPHLVPNFNWFLSEYVDRILYPEIEQEKVLLTLSNYDPYYFRHIFYFTKDEECPSGYETDTGIWNSQESYIIKSFDGRIDLRYIPHYQNVEFYVENTDGAPWYIENAGDDTLYARTSAGVLRLEPGERKKVTKENAEKDEPILPGEDLYPVGGI